jgi:hypothetical protein
MLGMIQGRNRPRLTLKALLRLSIFRKIRRENLDGYGSLQPSIASAIHLAHAARAERLLNLIRPELCAEVSPIVRRIIFQRTAEPACVGADAIVRPAEVDSEVASLSAPALRASRATPDEGGRCYTFRATLGL